MLRTPSPPGGGALQESKEIEISNRKIKAAANGHCEALTALIAARADINAAMTDGTTPSWWAAQEGDCGTPTVLIAARADINAADEDGDTPSYMAAQNGHCGVLAILIEANADISAAAMDGWMPPRIAVASPDVFAGFRPKKYFVTRCAGGQSGLHPFGGELAVVGFGMAVPLGVLHFLFFALPAAALFGAAGLCTTWYILQTLHEYPGGLLELMPSTVGRLLNLSPFELLDVLNTTIVMPMYDCIRVFLLVAVDLEEQEREEILLEMSPQFRQNVFQRSVLQLLPRFLQGFLLG
ncbi:unnamed protein product, partial [Polarella glacialis]